MDLSLGEVLGMALASCPASTTHLSMSAAVSNSLEVAGVGAAEGRRIRIMRKRHPLIRPTSEV